MKRISKRISIISVIVIAVLTGIAVLCVGENGAVQQNSYFYKYDLPILRYMGANNQLVGSDSVIPIAGGAMRDYFPSEIKLANILFALLPFTFAMAIYTVIKMLVAVFGALYLLKSVTKDKYDEYAAVAAGFGFMLGCININPSLGLSLVSIPLLLAIVISLSQRLSVKNIFLLFLYPILSDFIHVGIYLIWVIIISSIVLSIKRHKLYWGWYAGVVALILGYGLSEYHLLIIRSYDTESYPVFQNMLYTYKGSEGMFTQLTLLYALPILIIGFYVLVIKKNCKDICFLATMALGLILIIAPVRYNYLTNGLTGRGDVLSYKKYYSVSLFQEVSQQIDFEWADTIGLPSEALINAGIKMVDINIDITSKYIDWMKKEYNKASVDDGETVNYDASLFNTDLFKEYLGRYLLSGQELMNAEEAGFELVEVYTHPESSYTVYLYRTISRYTTVTHSDIPFEERTYDYSIEDIEKKLSRGNEILKEADEYKKAHALASDEKISEALGGAKELGEIYEFVQAEIQKIQTCEQYNELMYYKDYTNIEYSEKQNEMTLELIDSKDLFYVFLREWAGSPYKSSLLDILGPSLFDSFVYYEEVSEEEKDIVIKGNELKEAYYSAYSSEYYFDYNGEEWSFDRLYNEAQNLSEEDFNSIEAGLYAEKGRVIGDIYLELIKLNDKQAKNHGYKNYAEAGYIEYQRDYSTEDAKQLFKEIRKNTGNFRELIHYPIDSEPEYKAYDDRATFTLLKPLITDIDEELGESLDYLLRNNLFDLSSSETKANIGMSMSMDSFGDAYILDSPFETNEDLFTYVHEFGHYNNSFRSHERIMDESGNMDILEIHSQGLEALVASRYDELFDGDTAKYYEISEINALLDLIHSSSMVAEFELYAYEHPDSTLEELCDKYIELEKTYGYAVTNPEVMKYGWMDVGHLFDYPMYYVSYAVSALVALEIYVESYEDYDSAVNRYMLISTMGSGWQFKNTCEMTGIEDIFEKGNISRLIGKIKTIYENKYGYK